MGCGAVCGSSSSIFESSKEAQLRFMNLFQQISPNKYLYPIKAIASFAREMKLYPHKLNLILTEKLEPKSMVPSGVMEKWKIILFGLDSDLPVYVNCLGYPQSSQRPRLDSDNGPTMQSDKEILSENHKNQNSLQTTELFQHKAFSQIEKDIDRTFPGIDFQKKSFTMILRRITNHFPVMGYTQGINFIIGYLLIIGYSQFDAFWLFVHMAVNRRYLILGLYQDGFPLINTYISIFRNMLKRLNKKLFQHLYENVQMFDQSAWVFKWFMTCYLSSFPLQMCQYVWDLLLCTGSLGLVKFAICLVSKLDKYLLQIDQACDLTQFLSGLKQIDTFNTYLNIKDIIKMTYSLAIEKQDLIDLEKVKTENGETNFYAKYILFSFQENQNQFKQYKKTNSLQFENSNRNHILITDPISLEHKKVVKQSQSLLDSWHNRLILERKEFKAKFQQIKIKKNSLNNILDAIKQQISIQLVPSKGQVQKIEVIELPSGNKAEKVHRPSIQHFDSLDGMLQSEIKKIQRLESVPASPKNKSKNLTNSNRYGPAKKTMDPALWDQSDEEQQKEENKDKMSIEDELYYISKDIRFKRKSTQREPNDILSQFSNPTTTKENKNAYQVKINIPKEDTMSQMNIPMQRSRLARVGNSVLSNMSASNASGRSSASSHSTIHKQNSIGNSRACKCVKNKTQQNNIQNFPATRKYLRINKKVEDEEHQKTIDDIPNIRKRMNTSKDWMANSHGPAGAKQNVNMNMEASNAKIPSEIGSEVQIHNVRMFKKKKKFSKTNEQNIIYLGQNIHGQQVHECQSRNEIHPHLGQQESCQSFFIGNASERKSQICEIESVK